MENHLQNSHKNIADNILAAAWTAGGYIKDNAFGYGNISWKEKDDPVTDIDKNAERIIRERLQWTDAQIIGEEYGTEGKESDLKIYIDPIDGTKSFVRGEFHSSVSIAAEHKGELFFGCVNDFMRDIMYYADRTGAYIIFNHGIPGRLPLYKNMFSKIYLSVDDPELKLVRYDEYSQKKQTGSVALSMAQLALGAYDGLIMEPHKKNGRSDTCDIAAGYYIMKQAGLYIRDRQGKEYDYKDPHHGIIALRAEISDKVMEALKVK